MLDAAAIRIFEAYAEMVAESSTNAVRRSKNVVHRTPTLRKDKQLSYPNAISYPLKLESLPSEPQNRKKRRRTSEEPSFQQLVAGNLKNLGLIDKSLPLQEEFDLVSSPQCFTFQSKGVKNFVGGFELDQSPLLIKNLVHLPRKSASRVQRNLSNAGQFDLVPLKVGSERKEWEKLPDFSKEIENAISRIESLIPSLQKLVNSAHPLEQKNVGNFALPNISSSVNPIVKERDRVITRNELSFTEKSAAFGENAVGKQERQMQTRCNIPAASRVKWRRNCIDDDVLNSDEDKRPNVNFTLRTVNKPQNWISAQNDGRMKTLELEKNPNAQITQVRLPNPKAIMGRPDVVKGTYSRSGSFACQNPERTQGLTIMPPQCNRGEVMEEDVNLRPSTDIPSVVSTSSTRHNTASNVGTSHQKWSQSCRSGRIVQGIGLSSEVDKSRDSVNRNTVVRKVVPHDRSSEETSWSSRASSSATTRQSGGSPSSSSGTYESSETDNNDTDENEPLHEKLGQSTRSKRLEVTENNASSYDDDTPSYDNSQDDREYSDAAGPSRQMSSGRSHKWDSHFERRKRRGGGFRTLGKKLGMIFHHHHHHHHHHYSDKEEPEAHHARSFWKRLGEMLHHTKNTDRHHKPKVEKSRKSEIKTVAKTKDQVGHFHALVGGFMKHMKHSNKPKLVKNGLKRFGNGRHGGKKKGKKLPWWPKLHGGKGGVKVSNKGKVKFGNYRTKSMAAAKMILGK